MVGATRLPVDTDASALAMAEAIFGQGVTVVGASYSGDQDSSGIWSDGDRVSPRATPADSGVILSTGDAADFTNWWGSANHSDNSSTNTSGINNDSQFNDLAGTSTYDASILDIDIIPDSDTLSLQFVFASDEYPEYSGSIYNDAVGVWVNGQPAQLTVGDGSTSVGNVNQTNNINLYNDNTSDQYNTEMDGFTVTMTLKMAVTPGEVNSIRIGIADVSDSQYDSSLLIAGESGQTALIAQDDSVDIVLGGTRDVDVLANDDGPDMSSLSITHINGQEVAPGDTITLATGQQVTLNPDGTLGIAADNDEESVNFTYTVANGTGNGISDTAFVTLNTIPCFVAGSRIATPDGDRPVEDLRPGDLVMTHDDGPQPIRWTGCRTVAARGRFAPVRIEAGTFGAHGALTVSPQHRVLIRDSLAELLFAEGEVLVAAKDLVNGRTVRFCPGGPVDYVHIMFDRHQVVWSEGLPTESFLPGPQTGSCFERDIVREICALFPELDPDTGDGYSPAARRTLRRFEARLLIGELAAA